MQKVYLRLGKIVHEIVNKFFLAELRGKMAGRGATPGLVTNVLALKYPRCGRFIARRARLPPILLGDDVGNRRQENMTTVRFSDHETQIDLPPVDIIFGRTPEMQVIRRKLEMVAKTNVAVLVQGESGTGKELLRA